MPPGLSHLKSITAYAAGRSAARLSTHTAQGLIHGPVYVSILYASCGVYKNIRMLLNIRGLHVNTQHGVYLSAGHKAGAAAKGVKTGSETRTAGLL